jgi:glucosamine--fructose-6-phosphate aminotransferase (isomerizing)
MAPPGAGISHTQREILSQPAVWATTLETLDPFPAARMLARADDVLVIGCGSTHYLAMTAAALLRDAGLRAWPLPSSELIPSSQRQLVAPERTVVLAISRSGTTTETTRAVQHCREVGVKQVIAVTCDAESTLAGQADLVLAAPEAQEQSVAQTRSFSTMTVMVSALAGAVAEADLLQMRVLPDAAEKALSSSGTVMASLARSPDLDSFYFLGSGPLFGVASEGMLKLKEMSLTTSEAYHSMEFRHGPMSMCGSNTGVISLVTPERRALDDAVAHDLGALSAAVTSVGPMCDVDLEAVEPWLRPALYLLPLQLLALERALTKGLDPDQPRHLTAVIHLEDQ